MVGDPVFLAGVPGSLPGVRFGAANDVPRHRILDPVEVEGAVIQAVTAQLGHWVAADKSVPIALYAFLLATDFESAIRRAIGIGGDTDTIAAMAGAVAGARWGMESISENWLNVEGHARLADLADGMVARID